MNSEIQIRLLNALYACLIPITRILLGSGITYRQFADVAKRAFVREAFAEADSRGRKANTSCVAVRTGLSRKEVRRVRQVVESVARNEILESLDHSGPPARVLHAWHVDPTFVGEQGTPKVLPFDGVKDSFTALVHAVAGDVPPGAVRAELRRAGAIIEHDDGGIQVTKRYYVPGSVDERAITTISGMFFPLAAGLAHNTNPTRESDGFIQRFAFSDRLPPALIPAFRYWARAEAIRFIESMDDWLAAHEVTGTDQKRHEVPARAGIGVFYYEGPSAEELVGQDDNVN
ncbi:MAG: DUF6502 family protein [Steroidobacteraceae bacterium]